MTQQGLLNLILANLPDNIVQAIEPKDIRDILNGVVNTLFDNISLATAAYAGPAGTTTDPGEPESNVFYIATAAGTYNNFKDSTGTALTVTAGELAILNYDGSAWVKQTVDMTVGALTSSDIEWNSLNLFNPTGDLIAGELINSTGGIQSVTGWSMNKLDVSGMIGDSVTWGNFNTTSGVYYAFYDASNTLISFDGWNPNPALTKTVTIPSGAKWLYIDIQRPEDTTSVWSNGIINKGTSLLNPYQPYNPIITKIDGKTIAGTGGTSYDQSLNTTDNVSFNSVSANEMEISGTIKTGTLASPPAGLISGEFWLDTTDSSTHPLLRRKA